MAGGAQSCLCVVHLESYPDVSISDSQHQFLGNDRIAIDNAKVTEAAMPDLETLPISDR